MDLKTFLFIICGACILGIIVAAALGHTWNDPNLPANYKMLY